MKSAATLSVLFLVACSALSDAAEVQCDAAVSISSKVNNHVCRHLCATMVEDPDHKPEFDKSCAIEGFVVDKYSGKVKFEGDCLNQWVSGYSDDGLNFDGGRVKAGTLIKDVQTISECQEACQVNADCVNFVWRIQGNNKGACLLKNRDIVNSALAIKPESGGVDTAYCNPGVALVGHFLECDGVSRCIWNSNNHIAGPKYCEGVQPSKCDRV